MIINIKDYTLPLAVTERDKKINAYLLDLNKDLKALLNGGISFAANIDCDMVDYTSNAVADTEDTVAHELGKVPTGYIVYSRDKAAILYNGTTEWTKTSIYLKSSVASTAYKLIVF